MITLHVFPTSPRAAKVIALVDHLKLDCEFRIVDLFKGEQQRPEYAALNPNQRMPVLEEDGFVLWESNAILQYLACKRPQSGLLPAEDRARFDVIRWQFWDSAHWDPACSVFAFEYLVKGLLGIGAPDAAAVAKGAEMFQRAASVLDAQLAGKKFITGEALTLADFSIGSGMILAGSAHYPIDSYGEIKRWYAGLTALPAWQKTLAQSTMRTATAA